MKLLFLGTGAADWITPTAMAETSRRRCSSALIDDTILIDPGPHVLEALKSFGKDKNQIKYIINTHMHSDHYNKDVVNEFLSLGATVVDVPTGKVKSVAGYKIRSFRGNHFTSKKTKHFIIQKDASTLFYGLDGAWLLDKEVAAIKKYKPNLAVLDCTIGNKIGDYRIFEHNNIAMVKEIKSSLNSFVDRFIISHMARTLHASHKELVNQMKEFNIDVAFDGLEVEI